MRIFFVIIVLCCSFKITWSQETDPREVNALQALRRGLTDPMSKLNNWRRDPCRANWTGILCFNETAEDGYLHVRELQLLNMNLSGTLAPELGQLSRMEILDVMWNKITGSIPKEIGNIASLKLLLLNGNELSGSLPEEIGKLLSLDRIQIDQNHISGPLPKSFANLTKAKHFHMNNNSISGQIPPELSRLPNLVHLLLDNNNLSGSIPPELSLLPNLLIIQLDNNNFSGTSIPPSFKNMTKLLKLSLRNCNLQGAIPDLSGAAQLGYLDLSWNQLDGSIPTNKLSSNLTTIDFAYNQLNGSIPSNFIGFPFLQKLSLRNNSLTGEIPSGIWDNGGSLTNRSLILDFQNNALTNISGVVQLRANVTIRLQGNPLCRRANQLNITDSCRSQIEEQTPVISTNPTDDCLPQACPTEQFYEYNKLSPLRCKCAAPVRIGYRLKSPGFSDFLPYVAAFNVYLTSGLNLNIYQLTIDSLFWEKGPRLRMYLKLFPVINSSTFNTSEIIRVRSMFTGWNIPDSDIFGPYELLNFTLLGPYAYVIPSDSDQSSKRKKGVLAAIILGIVAGVVTLTAAILIIFLRRKAKYVQTASRRRHISRIQVKIEGVKDFTFGEMSLATNNFSDTTIVGQGGYGKVYKGILGGGTVVAIKRAEEGSMQGSKEFFTEIELLSRLHHRNLVSLIGYCDEKDEQMLVYEFMSNGSLRDHLSAKSKQSLSFSMRLRLAIGSARGILYLHTEADPPIIHRDIKASNILLDSKFTAKVADFGLSRLAPVADVEGSGPGQVSTVVKGTPGYLDPEYFLTHKLTDKSDVYSLGVVFLELLTGMQPISHGKNLVREVNMAYQSGVMYSVIDSRMGSYSEECVGRFFSLALRCCQDETDARPSMSDVVRELENIKLMMPEADATPSVYTFTDISKDVTTPSSSVPSSNPFVSMDAVGSDLQSGVMPTVIPR